MRDCYAQELNSSFGGEKVTGLSVLQAKTNRLCMEFHLALLQCPRELCKCRCENICM